MKMILSAGYLTTTLLGSLCPLQMVAAMPMEHDSMQHEEMDMTPMVPMTPVAFMSVAPVSGHSSHATPMPPSGDCTTGHCFMVDHSNQEPTSLSLLSFQLTGGAALPVVLSFAPITIDSLPAPPPEVGNRHLAQTISTIVLRV